ncbi:UDP-N-acetylglucosamine 1-carboxyvinyltransferase [Candidatus Termititenax persephonae]|uniref:UDP-N-acetylglucosamine 1-carboxyvinyltransferase n=1 Tax=Candidatus Termititenax persephonae TaxID=2218525 RepID=A0A388TFC1_9BACT|nr:UDP-N-acetylglucosamine 1-carboxyvinyltransferase [Candidatus Termititenax persephonae]
MAKVKIIGEQPLHGAINISGAKNSALPILAAAVLLDGESIISNVPQLTDITTMVRMLRSINILAEQSGGKIRIVNKKQVKHLIPYELVTKMRASFFIAGPILAKVGMVRVPMPGGCAIGSRPVDIHLKGFQALGAVVSLEHGFIEIRCKKLKGGQVNFPFPSVGATENIMMAATLAEGVTTIANAAREPEIVDLADLLNEAGANISGAGSSTIVITGVSALHGVKHAVIPDRIEAGTMLLAGLITRGQITVNNVRPADISALLSVLSETGARFEIENNSITAALGARWRGAQVVTQPYPGFPTDMQAQLMAYLALAEGASTVRETIFENRFMHIGELQRMGARIRAEERTAIIEGVAGLSGAEVKATDLRAGAALWLAGLAAQGETTIYGVEHIERGYEKLTEKLSALGARIKRIN